MLNNFLDTLYSVLRKDTRLIAEDGTLLKNKAYTLAIQIDQKLIKLLLGNEDTKKHFFTEVEGILVFDKIKFGWVVNNREFLPDSYTQYKNKIGLVDGNGGNISNSKDVVLVWPYKDCVLEGGQTEEEQSRSEIFYNESLAPDEVDRLLYPKVFSNARRYTKDGDVPVGELFETDNLLIKGNNLLSLSSILKRYEGKVQCICIDPPYNKETNEFGYNDNFNHSTWLTFMKNRIEYAKRLMAKNGTIFIFCDDSEQAYLRVMMDELFGRERYIATIIWRNCDNSNNDAKQFSQDHNYIIVYSKNDKWQSLKLDRTEEQSRHYKNPDNNPRGPWFDGNPVNSPSPRKNLMYDIIAPNGNKITPPPNGWRWDPKELEGRMKSGEIRFNSTNTGIIRRTYLYEQKGLPPSTLWDITDNSMWVNIKETGHTRQAKYEQKKIFPHMKTSDLFKTPKPEKVISKILEISTRKGELVLDFFGGSGTTGAVAHKMERQYILCEQMNYMKTIVVERMKQVIELGGSFIYCELKELNQQYVNKIQDAKTEEELLAVWKEIANTGFISHYVRPSDVDTSVKEFEELSFENKKRLFLELIDKNMLYVNLCDIDDEKFSVSDTDKAFNRSFYGRD